MDYQNTHNLNSLTTNNQLLLLSIDYKNSTIEVRELIQLNRKEIPDFLKLIKKENSINGAIIVSTCNRIEFYLSINNKDSDCFSLISNTYKEYKNIDISLFRENFKIYQFNEVSKHLFRVISGLESLIIGEYQIQGQIKEAYSIACQTETVDKVLHKLMHASFRTGKRVRSETKISEGKQSVSGVASKIMIEQIPVQSAVAIIGVNENTRIFASELIKHDFSNITFINRTLHKAEVLALEFNGTAKPLIELESVLLNTKAVFSCTGASGFIIESQMLNRLHSQNRCPELFIDMAIPRDIDTSALNSNYRAYCIDNLKDYLNEQKKQQLLELPQAEKIIYDEVSIFDAWLESDNHSILEPYKEKFEQIRLQLLDENKDYFSKEEFEKYDKLSRKFLHRLESTLTRIMIKNNEQKN